MKPLSNLDIDKFMINCTHYRGTFSKDMLPRKINKNESTIVNLQDYFAGNGTHWVCIYNDDNSENVEYFDSFGLAPPNEVIIYMKTANKNIIYNDSQIQNINSILCGYYCLYYIMQRNKGKTPNEALGDFHQKPTAYNEMFMKFYVSYIKDGNILCSRKKKN